MVAPVVHVLLGVGVRNDAAVPPFCASAPAGPVVVGGESGSADDECDQSGEHGGAVLHIGSLPSQFSAYSPGRGAAEGRRHQEQALCRVREGCLNLLISVLDWDSLRSDREIHDLGGAICIVRNTSSAMNAVICEDVPRGAGHVPRGAGGRSGKGARRGR